jgi:putative aminopeptidase FrvX
MDREALVALLTRCLTTHSPSGREEEMIELVSEELRQREVPFSVDDVGNIRVAVKGHQPGCPVIVAGHTDEVGAAVKRIEQSGRLRLAALGGTWPYKYGEGPVEVLGDAETIVGVLSCGPVHVTSESKTQYAATQGQAALTSWADWWVETKRDVEQLEAAGVRAGSRVVPHRARKDPVVLGDFISGYALDDKASIPVLLGILDDLLVSAPARDVIVAFTTGEELGCASAIRLAHDVEPCLFVAVETGTVAEEYGTRNIAAPIIGAGDRIAVYDDRVVRALCNAAGKAGIQYQISGFGPGACDASWAYLNGHVPRAAKVAIPCENTHGWEVCNLTAIQEAVNILTTFLRTWNTA